MNRTSEFLSREECKDVFDRVVSLCKGGGETHVSIQSRYTGGVTWARNRAYITRAVNGLEISIARSIKGAVGNVVTSGSDDTALMEAVRKAESSLLWDTEQLKRVEGWPLDEPILNPTLWSDSTYAFDGTQRGELAQTMIAPAEDAGLLAAGDLLISGEGHATINTQGMFRYYPVTSVACSMTVRNPKGTASGWAGKTHYTLDRIDTKTIAAIALNKCMRSADPVAIEPGRYTAILEPQAVADLLGMLVTRNSSVMDRTGAEIMRMGPFAFRRGRSKIGQQVLDKRLTIHSDPLDPDAGFIPFSPEGGDPYVPTTWIKDGYLRELWYLRDYALGELGKPQPLLMQGSYRLSSAAPSVSIEEMISTTKRGILVTRFSNSSLVHRNSMLSTGFTRDGVWLIENGKISKPVKNLRFTESPMFIFNNVESIGDPVRVFNRDYAQVVPAIKVRDFSFTSLADAV